MPPSLAPSERRSPLGPIAVLLVLALAWKAVVLAMPPEEISPGGVPDSEEWRRGMAALQWLNGSLLNPFDLQIGHFQGGTLLTVALVTLSFGVFDDSPLTMRFANVAYDWVAIAFLFLVVDRFAGRRAAWIAGILAAVPATGYSMLAAQVWASHVEANAFAMLILWLWIRHVFDGKDGRGRAFVLGVVAGFALWFHYGLLLWLAVLLAVELLLDRGAWRRRAMGVRIAGVLVGLLPWWIHNLRHEWQGLGLYGRSARGHFAPDVPALAQAGWELVSHWLPGSQFLWDRGGLGIVLEYGIFAGAAACWVIVTRDALRAWRREREVRPELVLAIYPVLWSASYVIGTFQGQPGKGVLGFRYMMPLYPIAWICAGIVIARMPRGWWRIATVATITLVYVSSTAMYLRPDHADDNATADIELEERLGRFIFLMAGDNAGRTQTAVERMLKKYEPAEADRILFALGNCLMFSASVRIPDTLSEERIAYQTKLAERHTRTIEAVREVVPPQYVPYFWSIGEKERAFGWDDRAAFWRQWDRRGLERPEGAFAH